jgi:hypothetical protein
MRSIDAWIFKNGPFLVSIAAILSRTAMSSFAQKVPGVAMELSAVDCWDDSKGTKFRSESDEAVKRSSS